MNNLDALKLANEARTNKTINKWRRDAVTGEIYTVRGRIESNAYAYRTIHTENGKRDSYGLILRNEIDGEVNYLTPVTHATKLAFDYASHLPVIKFDDSRGTIEFVS